MDVLCFGDLFFLTYQVSATVPKTHLNDTGGYLGKESKNILEARKLPQNVEIKGVVKDVNGAPLIGATVIEEGTTNGAQTNFDGNFSMTVSNENVVLVVSYLGFATKEVRLNGQTTISITLEEDTDNLDEIVIVGYGTSKKSEITGAVGVVTS